MINIRPLINHLHSNPKKLFFVDGCGALLTAFMLGVVLMHFERRFGMPKVVLSRLSLVAGFYAVYSFGCFFWFSPSWPRRLRNILVANLLYTCVTLFLLIRLYENLTGLGVIYFLLELFVMVLLMVLEMMVLFKEKDKT